MSEDRNDLLNSINLPYGIKDLKYDELEQLAAEVRRLIIEVTSKNGGHIAPSLGVVELTLAILKTFDLSKDKVIWDVGHQTYAYKILTDRLHQFNTVRQYKGISGFSRPEESPFDTSISGHASTSISTALGIVEANSILGREGKVVAVIGDGAMTGGMALEALNNLSSVKKNIIIILNDNEMSISANVGGFSSYMSKSLTSEFTTKVRYEMKRLMQDAPIGSGFLKMVKKFEAVAIRALTPGAFFESLGIRYIGPIKGHKIKDIESALVNASLQKKPVVVHIATVKGKGYEYAEKYPDLFHGISSFNIETGEPLGKSKSLSWTDVFGRKLESMAERHDNIVAITAAMKDGTGLKNFSEKYPDRFFDVGIAEQHAVTFSAGLAISGIKPYCTIYSTFLQRAYDQIIHDVAIQKLPVTFCIDRGGFVGADGSTHHGVFDKAYLRTVPNITIMLPKDKYELEMMLEMTYSMECPVAVRYARGPVYDNDELPKNEVILGEPEIIFNKGNIGIVSAGHIFSEVYEAYKKFADENVDLSLINIRFIKPLKEEKLIEVLKDKKLIVTVEEGTVNGGMGEMILSLLSRNGLNIPVLVIGIADEFYEHGSVQDLRKEAEIDGVSIYRRIQEKAKDLGII